MDSKQIDTAMRKRSPVVFDGIRYGRIIEYVSWYNHKGERRLSVVLEDRNSTIRVPADKVELAEK